MSNNAVIINYSPQSASIDEMLRYAQLIADAFSKALDQNECNVKILIGLRQQIKDDRDTLRDLYNITSGKNYPLYQQPYPTVYNSKNKQIVYPVKPEDIPPEVTKETLKRLKEKCYDCEFNFPKITFHNSLKFSFERLKLHINMYLDAFKSLNPNFCHVSGALNWSCLQDLIKLITLLLSAYSAVLALRKISGISLNMFIKGVISGLLGQIIGNLRLQVDLSQTGLACLIKVFEEIANNIPDGSTIHSQIPPGLLEDLGLILEPNEENRIHIDEDTILRGSKMRLPEYRVQFDENGKENYVFTGWVTTDDDADIYDVQELDTMVKRGELQADTTHHEHHTVSGLGTNSSAVLNNINNYNNSDSDFSNISNQNLSGTTNKNKASPKFDIRTNKYYQDMLRNFNDPKGQNFLKTFTQKFKKEVHYYEQTVSNAFKYVNDTIEQAIEDFNTNIEQIFGLIDYFQCEAERTGPGFTEILDLIQRLATVINLISSIISLVARRQIEKLCKTKGDIADVSDILVDDVLTSANDTYNDLYPLDVVNDFLGKVVVNTTKGNGDIVPIIYNKDSKPLLPKLNFKTCNLNEFIDAHKPSNLIPTIIADIINNPNRPRGPFNEDDDGYLVTGDPKHKGVPLRDVIDKERWIEYSTQFVPAPIVRDDWIFIDKNGNLTDISIHEDNGYGVKNILDLVYNNPLPRSQKNPDTNNTDSTDTSFRTKITTPFYSEANDKDKKAFENKCRDINDVLDIVETLRGITK